VQHARSCRAADSGPTVAALRQLELCPPLCLATLTRRGATAPCLGPTPTSFFQTVYNSVQVLRCRSWAAAGLVGWASAGWRRPDVAASRSRVAVAAAASGSSLQWSCAPAPSLHWHDVLLLACACAARAYAACAGSQRPRAPCRVYVAASAVACSGDLSLLCSVSADGHRARGGRPFEPHITCYGGVDHAFVTPLYRVCLRRHCNTRPMCSQVFSSTTRASPYLGCAILVGVRCDSESGGVLGHRFGPPTPMHQPASTSTHTASASGWLVRVGAAAPTAPDQRAALVELYISTNGSTWSSTGRTGWLNHATGSDPCDNSWAGVSCSGSSPGMVNRNV
jgi:hypothetical protein